MFVKTLTLNKTFILIFYKVFGECHAPCTLQTFFVELEKRVGTL